MSDKDKGGDKTELPTPKKLQDARKKGDIAKAQDITSMVGTFGAILLLLVAGGYVARSIAEFGDRVLSHAAQGEYALALQNLGGEAINLLIVLSAVILIPLVSIGILSEVFQTRGLFAPKRLEPKFSNLNPVEGLKKLFGKQGLVQLAKTLAKAIAVVAVVWFVARGHIEHMGTMLLPAAEPIWRENLGAQVGEKDASLTFSLTLQVMGWVGAVFVGIAIADNVWAKHDFTKRMMMSTRDIKQEVKQDEGDPHMKGHRRQLGQEWAQSGAVACAGDASALLVNPTHLAIALDYDPERAPVPVVLARGKGDIATAMREVAIQSDVPIIRHIPTARALWARGEVGEIVPEELFDAIAEVILWARRARDGKAPMQCDVLEEVRRRGEAEDADESSPEQSAPLEETA
ncbi:EscU/YscU/HrcU family type III secretion system export apparatus switch protein [Qipengyuania sp. DGS5-3]|uniref:EscU/YscU/HrcU family type III secretion system export apparatus switch protein n=1 Tax=Qipengyuania sp. DGS5-3 TaxID=3349632 RepID=UPI0036D2913F